MHHALAGTKKDKTVALQLDGRIYIIVDITGFSKKVLEVAFSVKGTPLSRISNSQLHGRKGNSS